MGKTNSSQQTTCSNSSLPNSEEGRSKIKVGLSAKLLLLPIYFYRYCISPFLAPRCRFYPTCSTYAVEAIKIHGALKGGYLACKRILRCNPLSEGGEDPVPAKCCNEHNQEKK